MIFPVPGLPPQTSELSRLQAMLPVQSYPPRPQLADEQNGWGEFITAITMDASPGEITDALTSASTRNQSEEDPRSVLHFYAQRLPRLRTALTKPWLQPLGDDIGDVTRSSPWIRMLPKAANLLAQERIAKGAPASAVDALLLVRECQDRFEDSEPMLIMYVFNSGARDILNAGVRNAVRTGKLPLAQLDRLAETYTAAAIQKRGAALRKALVAEHRDFFVPALLDIERTVKADDPRLKLTKPDYDAMTTEEEIMSAELWSETENRILRAVAGIENSFDPEATLQSAIPLLPAVLKSAEVERWQEQPDESAATKASEPWPDWAFDEEIEPKPGEIEEFRRKFASVPNLRGRAILRNLVNAYGGVADYARLEEAATSVLIQIARWKKTHDGAFPKSLDVLEGPTRDPFSGKPFRYDPKRQIFWSVGANGTDEGGKDAPGLHGGQQDDVYSLVTPEPIL